MPPADPLPTRGQARAPLPAPGAGSAANAPIPLNRPLPVPPGQGAGASRPAIPLAGVQPIPVGNGAVLSPAAPPGTVNRPVLVPAGFAADKPRIRTLPDDGESHVDPKEVVVRNAPPWLVSLVFHMLVLIALGLVTVTLKSSSNVVELEASMYAEQFGDELGNAMIDLESDQPEENVLTPEDMTVVEDPFVAPPNISPTADGTTATSVIDAPQVGLAFDGREEGMRDALLRAYGGNKLTEAAVTLGLEWLARQQKSDGSWSLQGPYPDAANYENTTAATAMALLAFAGNNHTHRRGLYQKKVESGIQYLLKQQDDEGAFRPDGRHNQLMYTHGQATIVLCELYAMTGDQALREPAERAVALCVKAQHTHGGWRYGIATDSDTSVTGWICMALQSARGAGLSVPQQTLDGIDRFLDRVSAEGGSRYSYMESGVPTETMTAEALLCRQQLGWSRSDPRMLKGAEYLLLPENLPSWDNPNVYYWYYATQMMHNLEGEYWTTWNGHIRDMLSGKQVKSGPQRGSWHPGSQSHPPLDRWGIEAGRLYMTCLSIYVLEVYYRHLPIYSRGQFAR